jgi:hypothetical protein
MKAEFRMRERKGFLVLMAVARLSLFMFVLLEACGIGVAVAVSGKLPFTESVRAGNSMQGASGKRRAGRRRRTTATSKSSNVSTVESKPQGTTPPPNAPPAPVGGPLSQVTYEVPIRKPRAGEEQVLGLLLRVDCDSSGATFIIKVGERQLQLRAGSFNSVKFTTYTPDVSGEMTCGQRNPASSVVATFRPLKKTGAKFNGEPVALEFVPKNFELKK